MKKGLKLLFASLLGCSLILAGCNKGGTTPTPKPEPPVVENKFPVKEVISFYEEAGLDVIVPSYVSVSNDFETDTSDPAAFVIYANSSTQEEMVAYKDALVVDSWVVANEADGDYLLKYAETDAVVSLVNFEEYIGIAFSIYEAPTGLSPEEAVAGIAAYWGGSAQEVQSGVFGAYGAFSTSAYSVEDMKGFVSSMFVPEEFELVNDWAVAEDGTNSCMYANAVLTVLEIYVYADTVYVKDGAIVEEGTEGAVATDVTCIEVYGYTYTE